MPNRKGFCPDCGTRLRYDPFPRDPDFFALCQSCGEVEMRRARREHQEEQADGPTTES